MQSNIVSGKKEIWLKGTSIAAPASQPDSKDEAAFAESQIPCGFRPSNEGVLFAEAELQTATSRT